MDDEDSPNFEFLQITTTLGSALIAWSHCEEATEHFLRDILTFHGLSMEAANVVASTLELRMRCTLSVALAYKMAAPADTLACVSKEFNLVQNELRSRRNRLIHDSWMFQQGVFSKRDSSGPKLKRPQSHKVELHVPEYTPVDLAEVSAFTHKCMDSSTAIHGLLGDISRVWFAEQRRELGGLLPGRRTGWLRRMLSSFAKR